MKMDGEMKSRKTQILIIVPALIGAIAVFTLIMKENSLSRAAAADARLACCDLADAAGEMADASSLISTYDGAIAFARAAGAAQAYMSRARLEGCESAYSLIDELVRRARTGEEISEVCAAFAKAVSSAEIDGGSALRELLASAQVRDMLSSEQSANADFLCLRHLGNGGSTNAEHTARHFSCKNCELFECESNGFPPSYVLSGKNVYICLTYDGERVLEYCFDRDVDLARDVGEESARDLAISVLDGQRLGRLFEMEASEQKNGIYRFCFTDASFSRELAVIEIYADTGRLRRFSAVEYYRSR